MSATMALTLGGRRTDGAQERIRMGEYLFTSLSNTRPYLCVASPSYNAICVCFPSHEMHGSCRPQRLAWAHTRLSRSRMERCAAMHATRRGTEPPHFSASK